MQVRLLVSDWCASCHRAEAVWQEVAEHKAIDYAVVDMAQPEGRALANQLRIRSIPAVVIEGQLAHVGVQPVSEAMALVAQAPDREAGGARHVGLGLSVTSRAAILGAMAYMLLAGAALPFGGLLLEGPLRIAAVHLFGLGFLTLLVYGLGEHMLPRFTGAPIRLGGWSWSQQALLHLGLWAIVVGALGAWRSVIAIGGLLAWLSLLLFLFRLWPVLWGRGEG